MMTTIAASRAIISANVSIDNMRGMSRLIWNCKGGFFASKKYDLTASV